jgi:hypothetical protein
MKISEVIEKLEEIRKVKGELDVLAAIPDLSLWRRGWSEAEVCMGEHPMGTVTVVKIGAQ